MSLQSSSPAVDDSAVDSSASTPTSSSHSSSPSSSDDDHEQHHLRRHSRSSPSHPPSSSSSSPPSPPSPPPNPGFPFPPDTSPPLSGLPLILSRNLSFTSEYGPFRMSLAAFFLGCLISLGLHLALTRPLSLPFPFGVFVAVWGGFHWLEFVLTGIFHPGSLSFNSFLLNHSRAFHVAVLASVVEYLVELALLPSLKRSLLWPLLALPLLLLAQGARSLSMWQASTNFTHLVSHQRHPSHQLITSGLYSVCRHPAYAAWYAWSILTQVLLANPLCAVGYAVVGFRFFQARIEYEEYKLVEFFGRQYEEYRRAVPTGIPFLNTKAEVEAAAAAQSRAAR